MIKPDTEYYLWCAGAWRDVITDIARNGYNSRDSSAEIAAAGYSLKDQIKILERIYSGEEI